MAYEDFTSYTEVDPNNHIALVGTDHIDSTVKSDEDAYLYKDYGAAHFGNFEHLVDARWVSSTGHKGSSGFWVVANILDDIFGLRSDKFIAGFFYETATPDYLLYLQADNGAAILSDVYSCATNTWYYMNCKRDAASITIKVYSDKTRLVLLDTLTIAHFAQTFKYVYACDTFNEGDVDQVDVDIEDLDLQEAVADVSAGIKLWTGSGFIELVEDNTSPVKIYTGSETVGVKLVATSDGDASPIRIFDGTITKAFKKKT